MRNGQGTPAILIPAKVCTAVDLELSEEEAVELFDAWANSTLICPGFDNIGKIEIEGDTSSIDSKNLQFYIEKNPRGFNSDGDGKKTTQVTQQ